MSTPRFLVILLFATFTWSSYVPTPGFCPSGESLVRAAIGLSEKEAEYQRGRKLSADIALKNWLLKTNPGFGTENLPIVRTVRKINWGID